MTAIVLVVAAVAAGWLAGGPAALGVLAAGALTVGNFHWLARGAAVRADGAGRARAGAWALTAGLRFAVVGLILALVLASGWVHPVAVVTGLTVLPAAVIVAGLIRTSTS